MKEADIRPHGLFNQYLELCRQDIERFFSDKTNFIEVPCPACAGGRISDTLEKFGFRYAVCADCGSLYASPRPPAASIDAFYRDAESVAFWATSFFKETAEARREKMFRPRALLIRELAERFGLHGSVFIDIGPGYGILLEEVQRLGRFCQIIGIEPAPPLAAICRDKGFPIIEKPLEQVQKSDVHIRPSFLTAFEVLEHLYDPHSFVGAAHRLLLPGGLFMLTTLTVSGFDIQVLWEHSKSIYPPQHINLLSLDGIEKLVVRAGFELVSLTTPGNLDVDIVANALRENPALSVSRFERNLVLNRSEDVREQFQAFLREHRLSSHVRVVARKKL